MIEVVLGSLTLLGLVIHATMSLLRAHNLKETLRLEGEQMKVNLDHVANAVVGLSELLDDVDNVIEDVSKIPTTGEVIMDILKNMIMSKMQPQLSPFPDNTGFISELLIPPEHGKTQESESETPE